MNDKHLKYAFTFSILAAFILLLIYFFAYYQGILMANDSILGYSSWIELLFMYIVFLVLSMPLMIGLVVFIDYHTDFVTTG